MSASKRVLSSADIFSVPPPPHPRMIGMLSFPLDISLTKNDIVPLGPSSILKRDFDHDNILTMIKPF